MSDANRATGALAGLRVLDLTGRMGGYCGLLLANLGAEVILIEPPGGDPMRREGPFKNDTPHAERQLVLRRLSHQQARSSFWISKMNRDRETLRELARQRRCVDRRQARRVISIELRLGYDALQALNPALVMTSITGFGLTGPIAISKRRASSPSPWAADESVRPSGARAAHGSLRCRLSFGLRACGLRHLGRAV